MVEMLTIMYITICLKREYKINKVKKILDHSVSLAVAKDILFRSLTSALFKINSN